LNKGKYIKEIKGNTQAGDYQPIGKNYIGKKHVYTPSDSKINRRESVLLDANLHKIKNLIEVEYMRDSIQVNPQKTEVLVFRDCTKGVVYKDKFYIGSTNRGFYFVLFDEEGNKLYEINREFQSRPVTKKTKEKIITHIKKLAENWKKYSDTRGFYFPDYYPAYISFAIDSDRIYVFTYPSQDTPGLLEVIILDLKGGLIKKNHVYHQYIMSI
jgi:hypothetical protein